MSLSRPLGQDPAPWPVPPASRPPFWFQGRSPRPGLAFAFGLVAALTLAAPALAANGDTLTSIRDRGSVTCGTNPIPGFGFPDSDGNWRGFFIDFCRALAAATLGDPTAFEVVPVESNSRWEALNSHTTDVNVDGSTWTLSRDTALGFDFPGVLIYDGQRFLAKPSVPEGSVKAAAGLRVCIIMGTTAEVNLRDFLKKNDLEMTVIATESDEGAWTSFLKGRCELFVNDGIGLALRNALHMTPPRVNHLMTEAISKEPLGPVVRGDDHQWLEINRWVLNVLIAAEEAGISSTTLVDPSPTADLSSEDRVFVGGPEDNAAALGLEPGWARRVIAAVGNYGEVFDRNLGKGSEIGLDRGVNALWSEGGLMISPPLQ
ncbi:amino acid ABC transporter substrate-binding protein [Rhodospirillum rubrum]|uniref:Extracellular solute-binding protein, family 3 n=1 Tax=Rhodospirillum rubrum (strain ATCC 11170 / ATH 1.1.1 / DSM 467 / LMG 4362 / NCIMB 8255 / S1) TaxID=269796 RepID=Q2RRD0_RHORT|nr:amino acid ABC transporter substrate-binding protein [Rhodospirillum rubrum]ABC23315.1 extracellular solute-binding protein, family 3 [Rhodospirillum rubrum ATCC 11170]AEO49048.1 extracellular solute-binding protein [Rhodospirillum rubrum F11]MBK5954931.1 ABC transporter substrate-binding protein [Rhodospirillum rubrum]QXG79288.1 amino acid ABC transporter substrate-binding protein [Rhodospirillum rubrum]HAP99694.1 amino acid ABC transporter substrate-binding protein [Rhodospirillum rubrum]